MTGWLCVLSWQTASAATAFQAGVQIQGLIALNKPDYSFEAWHGTLLVFAVSVFNLVFNIYFIKQLPLIEAVMLFVHVAGFIVIVAVLWATGPIGAAKEVFTTFNDYGGWNNNGLATMAGTVAAVVGFLGADAAVHLAEEVRDASKIVPLSMIWTTLSNGAMSVVIAITFCSTLGDLDAALASPTKQPYMYVFYNSTGSVAAASVLSAIVILVTIFCNISITTTSSRQLFAFARDKGVPFNRTLARVCTTSYSWSRHTDPTADIPNMACSHPRYLRFLRGIMSPIPNQPRLHRRAPEYKLPHYQCSYGILHYEHRLHSSEAHPQ
jgi:choline transport protein